MPVRSPPATFCRTLHNAPTRGEEVSSPMADHENYSASNRKLWDEWADVHASGTWYDLDAVRRGSDKLRPYEIDEVGDVRDRTLIHLMCQLGTDTLAWARRGADATGVDFSARAIAHARKLAADGGVDAKFICCDVLNVDTELHGRWDIVYTSRGVLGWIADMAKWADMVSRLLKPGGLVYLTDIHPIAKVLDDQSSDVRVARPYFPRPKPIAYPVKGSYADPGAAVTSTVKYL